MLVFIILLGDGALNVLVVLLIPEKEVQGGSTLGFSAGLQYMPEFKGSRL